MEPHEQIQALVAGYARAAEGMHPIIVAQACIVLLADVMAQGSLSGDNPDFEGTFKAAVTDLKNRYEEAWADYTPPPNLN